MTFLEEPTGTALEKLYPRVRVRDTEEYVSQQVAAASMLKAIESIFLKGDEPTKNSHSDQESREKVDPNKSCVITCPNSKDQVTPTPVYKDKRNNIRASSIPPPRAVLSSPDNDGIIGNQTKRIQEKARPLKGREPENFKKTNLHRAQGQRPYARTHANASQVRAKGLPFDSNMLSQSRGHNCDVKMEKQTLQESSSYRSASSEAAACDVYPKIKCSEIMRDQTPKPKTFKRG